MLVAQSYLILWDPMDCSPPRSSVPNSLLRFMSIESVMPSNHFILCRPLLLLPSVFPSSRVFSNESALRIRWPKYWSFSFNASPSNEYSGLISFRMDWFDLLFAQGILKNLLQHHNLKTSILQSSAFSMVQQSAHDYWKNHSFDYTDFLVSAFKHTIYVSHSFPSKEQVSFNFMVSHHLQWVWSLRKLNLSPYWLGSNWTMRFLASWASGFTWASVFTDIIGDKNRSCSPGVLIRINMLITHVTGLQQCAWSCVSDLEKSLRAHCGQED